MAKQSVSKDDIFTCKSCKCEVTDKAKILPFRIDGGNRDWETFCPQCFVHVRMPLEPLRYDPLVFHAVSCLICGWRSVAQGALRCGNCRSGAVLVLPPKKPS